MKTFGGIIIVIGLLWAILAFTMDTSVEVGGETIGSGDFTMVIPKSRVNNFGLMNDKQNYIMGSGITLLIGVILLIIGIRKEDEEGKSIDNNKKDGIKSSVKQRSSDNPLQNIYELNDLTFSEIRERLLEQYKPLGYTISRDLPNMFILHKEDSRILLKYSIGNNNSTIELMDAPTPYIIKEPLIPEGEKGEIDKLLKLSDMLEKGLLTKEEFNVQKNALLKK